jgi:hypothetical protein
MRFLLAHSGGSGGDGGGGGGDGGGDGGSGGDGVGGRSAADELARDRVAPGSPLPDVFDEDSEALSEYREFDFVTARPASLGADLLNPEAPRPRNCGVAAREGVAQAEGSHGFSETVTDDCDHARSGSRCDSSAIWSRARPESAWGVFPQ